MAVMTVPIKEQAKTSKYLGRHILAEFFECDPNVLNNPELVADAKDIVVIGDDTILVRKGGTKLS